MATFSTWRSLRHCHWGWALLSSGKWERRLCLGERLGVSMALCPPGWRPRTFRGLGLNAMTTSGRPAYDNLAGHPFGVNAKWLQTNKRHCHFPLTLTSISVSSPNVVGSVAGANWSMCGLITAWTVNMAVLYLYSYSWCKTKNRSHSTSGCNREHVSACFDYKGSQWNKQRHWCTKVNISRMTVEYLNATIKRKPRNESRRSKLMGLVKPGQICRLTAKGTGLARQDTACRVFGPVWNQPEPFFQSNPGPLSGYPDPLLTPEVVVILSQVSMPITEAKTLIMGLCHWTSLRLSNMYFEESLTLSWG